MMLSVTVGKGMCGKPKISLDSVLKNRTIQKFDICSDGYLTETACNPKFTLKVTKRTLLAFSMQIKYILKHYKTQISICTVS